MLGLPLAPHSMGRRVLAPEPLTGDVPGFSLQLSGAPGAEKPDGGEGWPSHRCPKGRTGGAGMTSGRLTSSRWPSVCGVSHNASESRRRKSAGSWPVRAVGKIKMTNIFIKSNWKSKKSLHAGETNPFPLVFYFILFFPFAQPPKGISRPTHPLSIIFFNREFTILSFTYYIIRWKIGQNHDSVDLK